MGPPLELGGVSLSLCGRARSLKSPRSPDSLGRLQMQKLEQRAGIGAAQMGEKNQSVLLGCLLSIRFGRPFSHCFPISPPFTPHLRLAMHTKAAQLARPKLRPGARPQIDCRILLYSATSLRTDFGRRHQSGAASVRHEAGRLGGARMLSWASLQMRQRRREGQSICGANGRRGKRGNGSLGREMEMDPELGRWKWNWSLPFELNAGRGATRRTTLVVGLAGLPPGWTLGGQFVAISVEVAPVCGFGGAPSETGGHHLWRWSGESAVRCAWVCCCFDLWSCRTARNEQPQERASCSAVCEARSCGFAVLTSSFFSFFSLAYFHL